MATLLCVVQRKLEKTNMLNQQDICMYILRTESPLEDLITYWGKENMCPVPLRIASCKINKIIAVLDQKNNSVIVLKENGVLLKSYKGDTEHMPLQLPILELEIFCNFSPLGICCSPGGPLFVSTADGSCLHILNHSGEVSFDQL